MESPTFFLQVPNSKTNLLGALDAPWLHLHDVHQDAECEREESPCYMLTVRIIRMRNFHRQDLLSESDCYVSLWLPTSSPEKFRTKMIPNCKDPVWNEIFYFRIQSQVKNVLELTVCDEDFIQDDDNRIILFDIANVPLGKPFLKKFELNPQKQEELDVEFTLESIWGSETITTNGAIVCRELSCLEVQINRKKRRKMKKTHSKHVKCTLKGSFEETQNISVSCASSLHFTDPTPFYYAKYKQAELDVLLLRKRSLPSFCSCMSCGREVYRNKNLTLPVNTFPEDQEVIKEDREFNLLFKTKDCTSGLDVRLGFDLCTEEQEFLQKRKKVVATALKRVLQLEEDLQDDEVPVVAIMTTGGGMRALTALYAQLLTMQQLGILDCVTYLTGLSGTTWTMSDLYNDPNWSQNDLGEPLIHVQKHMEKNKFLASFAPERLKYYVEELWQRHKEGHYISFTDLWGLIIEAMLCDGKNHNKLTDQQRALTHGQNPLPIYLCLNVKEKMSNRGFREWLDFTPYEVGFQKYGAYIRAEHFGSEFFMGHLMKKKQESRICFLEGIWSSVFSVNLMDAWFMSVSSEDFWVKWARDRVTDLDESVQNTWTHKLPTRVQYPPDSLASVFQDIVMWRPAVTVVPNFLKGCSMHNNYLESEFSKWKDCDLDSFPNQLTGAEDHLFLVDNAFAFDSSYPPLMRPQRKVDAIIHLNYSSGSQIAPLTKASEYFSELEIPFPKIIPSKEEENNVKECYLIGDKESPETPIVVHFALVNDTFREYKAPGIKRSPEEMEDGEVDLISTCSPYNINALRYSEKDFDKLVKMSQYNMQNNKDMLIKALRLVVERKRIHKKGQKA
ncbi:cytosolic phospholipase A2 epsilon-like isoform X3 [Hemicordylus capensis]|uniref:cytosolic phospholipase A2 epsilon-like isoform X3 n=1 Tax=Hemicordylus capensis TaxID=884348 RepID=UPI002304A3F2|nr:cytosolic phospholipase A2 epsilon-like isoform X3 [Hemicordylus capensis]